MRKSLLLTMALTLLTLFSINAQTNWKPGYIIYANGDTIHGSLLYKENREVSKFCDFKSANGESQKYFPTQITGYRFDEGKFYISKVIKGIANDEPVFVEFLIQGKVSLYRYNDGQDRYFAEKDTVLQELKNTKETQYIESKNEYYAIQKNEYIGTLGFLFQDANMQAQINMCEYRPKSMIKLAKTYHETVCTDEKCIVYERSVKPVKVVWGVHGGVNFNSFNYGDIMETGTEPSYLIGCSIEFLNFVDLKEKLSCEVDVELQKNGTYTWTPIGDEYTDLKYNGKEVRIMNDPKYLDEVDHLTVDFKMMTLRVPLTLKYYFTTSKVQPFIKLGLVNVLTLSQNKDFQVRPIGSASYDDYQLVLPKYQLGFIGKVGTKVMTANQHAFVIECGYEFLDSMNPNDAFRVKTNGILLSFGYNF